MGRRKGWPRRVVGELVRRLRHYDLMMMAAGIAFYWLLGLIPLLLLGSSTVGYLLGSSERGADEVMAAARRLIPATTGRDVEDFLRSIIQSRHITGVLGIGFLLWVGMGMFEAIASSLTTLSESAKPGPTCDGSWSPSSCLARPASSLWPRSSAGGFWRLGPRLRF